MDNSLEISVERIYKLDSDAQLKGFADISICGAFVIKGLKIVSGKHGLFVGMPGQLGKDGKWHNRVLLTDDAFKERLTGLILSAFEE